MIRTIEATGSRDESSGVVVVRAVNAGAEGGEHVGHAQLLLDRSGRLLGVDVHGRDGARTALMLGRQEDVASTQGAAVRVAEDGAGRPVRIVISGGPPVHRP